MGVLSIYLYLLPLALLLMLTILAFTVERCGTLGMG